MIYLLAEKISFSAVKSHKLINIRQRLPNHPEYANSATILRQVIFGKISTQICGVSQKLRRICASLNFRGPLSVLVTLLTLKQEVRGSNPSATPPKFGAHTLPYYPASRLQRCERDGVRKSRAPGVTKFFFSNLHKFDAHASTHTSTHTSNLRKKLFLTCGKKEKKKEKETISSRNCTFRFSQPLL